MLASSVKKMTIKQDLCVREYVCTGIDQLAPLRYACLKVSRQIFFYFYLNPVHKDQLANWSEEFSWDRRMEKVHGALQIAGVDERVDNSCCRWFAVHGSIITRRKITSRPVTENKL